MVESDAYDISNNILADVSNFAVGLVVKEGDAGSRVLGSGTLVSIEGRRGILTCGHVAAAYERLTELGLILFSRKGRHRRVLNLTETQAIIVQSSDDWTETDLDLAFTLLPPDVASSIDAQAVFLNIDKNREKIERAEPAEGMHVDVMLGLVAEYSEKPFVEGTEITSPMRAVLHTGHVSKQENGLLTFDAMGYNLELLPASFGGMSGGALWRVYFTEQNGRADIVLRALCGVAFWQIEESTQLACQGWDRIDQALIPAVRENFPL